MNNVQIAKQLDNYLKKNNVTEQAVATATNTDQSHVSRIRNGQFKRLTANVRKVCEYASIDLDALIERKNPAENKFLMEAIAEVWDGTNKRAKALAKVIRSLKDLS